MTTPSAVRNIPLDKLVPSPANVRKTPPSAAEDAELKASIRARGLKQNLVVHPAAGEKGVHAVIAGGRRLKALQELAAEGVIPADFRVPCLVEAPVAALETSLMENRIRAALSPADEFVAIAALIDSGETVQAVATRFGVSERHVRQRLRLGKLAPELLDACRNGDIGLDVVTAFTLGADHAAQLAVWHQLKDQSYIAPYTVRRLLTQTAIPLDADLGRFVGSAAYEAAGGTVTRDLFSGDDEGFMDDAALVRRLALEKLERKAAELRTSWAWSRAMLDPEYDFAAQYRRIPPQPGELPGEIAEEIERVGQRLAELEETPENEWTDALLAEAARLEERRDELAETVADLAVYSERDRAVAGVIVTIGDDGEFRLHQGLVERSAIGADDDTSDDETVGLAAREDGEISRYPANAEQALRKECGFSQLLVDDLKAYRLQITRAHLAADFDVAFDLALYALCADLFGRFGARSHPLDLRAAETPSRSSLNDLAGTTADRLLEAQSNALDLDWLKLPPGDGFAALAALPAAAKQRLFARCIALCLKPQLAIEDGADPVIEAAGRRLAIPFADYWRPTAANYWGRVKKAHGLTIAKEILGDRWARDHARDKKPELAAALETAFDPEKSNACIGLDRAAREAAAVWLPPGMAYADAAMNNAAAEPQCDEAAPLTGDADETAPAEIDLAAAELPAFLTEDEPAGIAINGASAH
ncbi:MAG TPA: ParB N-terminal domain-containing protein [Xanthobacteraceae bacterium]|nr:ParB N-terminal domain-containing protein [Xanthobacteraceae bacterium]